VGFSIRVAPGVRIRASSRGVRTSVGPRIARVHVGGGRTGFSTGLGPVTYYSNLSGQRGSTRSAASVRSVGRMTSLQASKLQTAQELQGALNRIVTLHRHSFDQMTRPTAPDPQPVDLGPLRSQLRAQNLVGIRLLARADRKAAKAEADRAADALAALQFAERVRQRDAHAAFLNDWWEKLLRNDPAVTEELLDRAFADNDAAAAILSINGAEAAVVVMVPDDSVVPDRFPTTTDAGNLSIRKMTKKDHDAYYRELVAGDVLVTVREAMAVAPGLDSVRVVAVRTSQPDAFGAVKAEALVAVAFQRRSLDGVAWDTASATSILHEASTDLVVNYRGAALTIAPIDLLKEPDVASLVAAIDLDEVS